MGWSCIPRALKETEDEQFLEAVTRILEDILNAGKFPEELNCTRLMVLNKTPTQTP